VSADTLCYFGDLGAVTRAAARALAPGGWLVFTVEGLPQDSAEDFHLNPHGRYSHGAGYVRRVHVTYQKKTNTYRLNGKITEGGKPVSGFLVAAGSCESADPGSS